MSLDIVKIFVPSIIAFLLGILFSPKLIAFLLKHKLWKKKNIELATDGTPATLSKQLYNDEEKKTPRFGGVVVWATTAVVAITFWILSYVFPSMMKFDFISRAQTWIPLFVLVLGGLIGAVDDYAVTKTNIGSYIGGGLSLKLRISIVACIAAVVGSWFYFKLGYHFIDIPFIGDVEFGILFIPAVIISMLAVFSGGIIDGVDGLSGGIMTTVFSAYGVIAITNNQIDIATFCFVVAGSILAFLWFNIPPAKFYMSETGMLGLTTSLTVVAFMTNAAVLLPVIAFPLFTASGSVIIQLLSKKYRGKKVFLVSPLHNHFQIKGLPGHNVTMRYWIVSIISAMIGIVLHIGA